MTIGKKLLLCFSGALALTLTVSVVSLQGSGSLGDTLHRVVDVDARKQFLAGEIDLALSDFMAEERGIIRRAAMKDDATVQKYDRDFEESALRLKRRMDEMVPLLRTPEGRTMLGQIRTASDGIMRNHQEFMRLLSSADVQTADVFLTATLMPLIKQTHLIAERLVAHQGKLMAAGEEAAQSSLARIRGLTLLMMALALAVSGVVIVIVRQVNRALEQIVGELAEGAEQTASAASQISSSSQSLASGSSEQAAALEETSATSEQINAMALQNTENSRVAAELVTASQQRFSQANQSLDQSVLTMAEINAHSDNIGRIIKVIDGIAFQTNILALNAAVEAARAGEAGMGFAVVADEVRSLARRSAEAAQDTATLIADSVLKTKEGKLKVDQVATAIRDITGESAKVKTLVDEVNHGSQEQARGLDQIGKALTRMGQVTQMTAANAEQSASAAQQLSAQSEALKGIVCRLSEMVKGSS